MLAAQSVHAAEPIESLYPPATHTKHVPLLGPVNPTLQTQLVVAVDPRTDCELAGQLLQVEDAVAPTFSEYVLAAQSLHSAEPESALNFPAGQNTHVSPFNPDAPGLQLQFVGRADA